MVYRHCLWAYSPALPDLRFIYVYRWNYRTDLLQNRGLFDKGERMIIVYVADKNYTDYLEQSIKSFRKFNPSAEIVVFTENKLNIDVKQYEYKLPKLFRNRGNGDRISNTAYLKLFLTELHYDKIIYTDCDTICQSPLNELWNMPCKYINLCESHSYSKKQAKAIGTEKYGNTGVMVMNLKNLRKINFTEKCLEVEKSGFTPSTGWQHDETCINVAMKDYLHFIDNKWNYCHNRGYGKPIPEYQANILHFIGKHKEEMLELSFYKDLPLYEITGKSVAIVGNAQSLFDKHFGKEIDSHDIVIRFNKGFPNKPEIQGEKTSIVMLACELSKVDIQYYKAKYVINRSKGYENPADFTISNEDRHRLAEKLGSQPSTGFMAIDMCLSSCAKSIDLYGFDFEKTPTFYNSEGYKTQHDYNKEKEIVLNYEKSGLLTVKE